MNTDTLFQGFRKNSLRIRGYDYTQPGAYFLTITTYKKEHLFGNLENDNVILNQRGKIAFDSWKEVPEHFFNVRIDEFIVMPNHFHGIIWIDHHIDCRAELSRP
jgi:REP element-mobilizing transposase RayT